MVMHLETCMPTHALAFACASSGGSLAHSTIVLETITRPLASSTQTAMGLKERETASRSATVAISSAASSVSTGAPGASHAPPDASTLVSASGADGGGETVGKTSAGPGFEAPQPMRQLVATEEAPRRCGLGWISYFYRARERK